MIDQTIVEQLLPQCSEPERAELWTKYNAYVRWLRAYQADQARGILSELDAAKRSLVQLVDEIQARDQEAQAGSKTLPNLMAAANRLRSEGWKIGKSKLYQEARAGRLKVNRDGTVTESELSVYAGRHLKKQYKVETTAIDNLLREEKKAQVALLKTREEKLRFEKELQQGKFLSRDAVLLEWSVKLGLLEAVLKNAARTRAVEWAIAVQGNPDRADTLYGLIAAEVDSVLDQLADLQEIKVRVRRNTEVPS